MGGATDSVDHPRFAVHYEPVNPANHPPRYCRSDAEIDEFLDSLGSRLPVMLEHLAGDDECEQASRYVRAVAEQVGVEV